MKKITFEVDPARLFDAVKNMGGNCAGIGERVAGVMMTGKSGTADDIGLAMYGIVFLGQEDILPEDESGVLPSAEKP